MIACTKFVVLTFVLSWTLWVSAAVAGIGPFLFLPGTIMPAAVALWLTWREEGQESVGQLVARLFAWRVSIGWYLFALTFMAIVKLTAAISHRLMVGDWPGLVVMPLIMLLGTLVSTPIQAGEETGWRGFVLPRLAVSMGWGGASLLVGAAWALWHLPMFYLRGGDMVGQSFPAFALAVIPVSVALTWVYARTGGSLLLVMLMHAAVNNTTGIVPSATIDRAAGVFSWRISFVGAATIIVLWLWAVLFLSTMPKTNTTAEALGRRSTTTSQSR